MTRMIHHKTAVGLAWIVGLCIFGTILISCSNDDEPEGTEQNNNGRKLRQLTITKMPITRATITDNTSLLGASWNAGDVATLLNVSAIPSEQCFADFTATSDAEISLFTGSISCGELDNLALIYPKVTPAVGNGTYTISLSGQKGTLADIAANYHYIYGVGQVESVTDNKATAEISSMKSLLSMAKFTFTDGINPIPVKTLEINYASADPQFGLELLGYPLTGTAAPSITSGVVVSAAGQSEWEPLTIHLDTETSNGVYVALFPVDIQSDFHFIVSGSGGTYTGTASARLQAGKYYPVNLILNAQ